MGMEVLRKEKELMASFDDKLRTSTAQVSCTMHKDLARIVFARKIRTRRAPTFKAGIGILLTRTMHAQAVM
ncbi:hypothetical protein M0802_007307 [Mischocyttarus mexicanus]|nr:hypothetical protein M0802_007307 [Mischocyttarus mexicanus]